MVISSSSNSKIQRIRGLINHRQDREQQHAFVVEGVRLVEEALISGWTPELVCFTSHLSNRGRQAVEGFRKTDAEVVEIEPHVMDQVTGTETPQGLLAVFQMRALPTPVTPNFFLIADNLRDPGNLGTLLRSAAAAGVQGVLLSPGTTDPFSPKVLRAGMGAHFRMPVWQRSWQEIQVFCKANNLSVLLAEADNGAACWDLDLKVPLALMVGSEAEGASQPARTITTQSITIPMPGRSESLNAATAASILLFEVVRQRRKVT